MEWVSPNADPQAWTAEIKSENGRLLSRITLANHLDAMRVGAKLYCMEATIEGRIIERKGILSLAISRAKEVLPLAELTYRVDWDAIKNKEIKPTDDEKSAFARLKKEKWDSKSLVRITGNLIQKDDKSLPILEVRRFQKTAEILPSSKSVDALPVRKE